LHHCSRKSVAETYLLATRCPVYRRHEWSEFLSCRDTGDESHETIPLDHALQPLRACVCKGCNAAQAGQDAPIA